jgi:flavin reductase (DIM6/NTAB) family NADH-FMN oxidoreductase RutF
MRIDPGDLPPGAAYPLLISTIVPRPIAWVSTLSPDGRPNLAPFSFFMGVAADPPTLAVAIGRRRGAVKDTARNLETGREFVVNVVTADLATLMVLTAGDFGPEVNEFAEVGLTPVPSQRVKPPRVGESPVNMECRLERLLTIGRSGTTLAIGEVVLFHIADDLWTGRDVDVSRLNPLGRLGGALYAPITAIREIRRPELDPTTGRLPRRPAS